MFAVEWQLLLADAEREFEDYFQIIVDRTPHDPRVKSLGAKPAKKRGKSSAKRKNSAKTAKKR
jgi:hypothetical protein